MSQLSSASKLNSCGLQGTRLRLQSGPYRAAHQLGAAWVLLQPCHRLVVQILASVVASLKGGAASQAGRRRPHSTRSLWRTHRPPVAEDMTEWVKTAAVQALVLIGTQNGGLVNEKLTGLLRGLKLGQDRYYTS